MAIDFNYILQEIHLVHHHFAHVVDTGFLILARMLGFCMIAPVLGRKDVPFNIKLGIALMLTCVFVWLMPSSPAMAGWVSGENLMLYTIQIAVNVTIGVVIGFIALAITEVIGAAGSMMNNQIGLSSAISFDPATRQQAALLEKLFAYIGLMIFFHLGGLRWLIGALQRSFEMFPVHVATPDLVGQISFDYIVQITGNSLAIATILVAPVMVVTMAVDLILGVVNRTAQQIQVFQLSFALKPCIGMAAFLTSLPIFLKMVENYLADHAALF